MNDPIIPHPEWEAEAYHRLPDPQFSWWLRVLEGLELSGDDRHQPTLECRAGPLELPISRHVDGTIAVLLETKDEVGEGNVFTPAGAWAALRREANGSLVRRTQ